MDRIINVRVSGYCIVKDSNCAGAQFEVNSTKLRIEFSEDWDGFAKTVTFWNALGENPVEVTLTTTLSEDITESTRVYLVPVPGEAMTEVGEFPFTIDGYVEGVRNRTVEDKLKVLASRKVSSEAEDPTPTQAEQLQKEIDGIINTIAEAAKSAEAAAVSESNAAASATKAETSAESAAASAEAARSAEDGAITAADNASKSESAAKQYIEIAEASVSKTSYIGDNGNWYEWDSSLNEFVDSGIKAQAGSTVYVGTNPPEEADVWINPEAEYDGGYVTKDELSDSVNKKADKTTVAESAETAYAFEFSAMDNKVVRLGTAESISFQFGSEELPELYSAGLSFDSGDTPTSIEYEDGSPLIWIGNGLDCYTALDGTSVFQPLPNTCYDILFYYRNGQMLGKVCGFAPAVSG